MMDYSNVNSDNESECDLGFEYNEIWPSSVEIESVVFNPKFINSSVLKGYQISSNSITLDDYPHKLKDIIPDMPIEPDPEINEDEYLDEIKWEELSINNPLFTFVIKNRDWININNLDGSNLLECMIAYFGIDSTNKQNKQNLYDIWRKINHFPMAIVTEDGWLYVLNYDKNIIVKEHIFKLDSIKEVTIYKKYRNGILVNEDTNIEESQESIVSNKNEIIAAAIDKSGNIILRVNKVWIEDDNFSEEDDLYLEFDLKTMNCNKLSI